MKLVYYVDNVISYKNLQALRILRLPEDVALEKQSIIQSLDEFVADFDPVKAVLWGNDHYFDEIEIAIKIYHSLTPSTIKSEVRVVENKNYIRGNILGDISNVVKFPLSKSDVNIE
jgi:hypothetical protein